MTNLQAAAERWQELQAELAEAEEIAARIKAVCEASSPVSTTNFAYYKLAKAFLKLLADHAARELNSHARLREACDAVLAWYDRDGSVGGACDPMEGLRDAIAAKPNKEPEKTK